MHPLVCPSEGTKDNLSTGTLLVEEQTSYNELFRDIK